jgi:hypothetical protein
MRSLKLSVLAALLALCAVLAACGDDEGDQAGSSAAEGVGELTISARGAGPYRTPGGDNSLQNHGREAERDELEEAATAAHAYFASRVEKDWAKACAQLTKEQVQDLGRLASRSKQIPDEGCPGAIGTLAESLAAFEPPTEEETVEKSTVDADSLRVAGSEGFLLYSAGSKRFYMTMRKEGGAWKVAALTPSAF